MRTIRLTKKPYDQRSDVNKIKAQWRKLDGLHGRDEPSAAIVRAATAVELSVNLAIRNEFEDQSDLSKETVNAMLKKANGLHNKIENLLKPLVLGGEKQPHITRICNRSKRINDARNKIVHSGYFSNRKDATPVIEECRLFIVDLVRLYKPKFDLAPLAADAIEDEDTTPQAEIEIIKAKAKDPEAVEI